MALLEAINKDQLPRLGKMATGGLVTDSPYAMPMQAANDTPYAMLPGNIEQGRTGSSGRAQKIEVNIAIDMRGVNGDDAVAKIADNAARRAMSSMLQVIPGMSLTTQTEHTRRRA